MYKEIRDLIHAWNGGIEKRRGLQIKKALASYYSQSCQDAADLTREIVEQGIRTLSRGTVKDHARMTTPSSEPDRGTPEELRHNGVAAPAPIETVQIPRRLFRTEEGTDAATKETRHAPFRTGPAVTSSRPNDDREFVPMHRRNAQAHRRVHPIQISGPQGVYPL